MNQNNDNFTELLNELQTFESLIGNNSGKANVAEANKAKRRPSSSKNKGEAKKKKNLRNNKGKGKRKIHKNKQDKVAPEPKGMQAG